MSKSKLKFGLLTFVLVFSGFTALVAMTLSPTVSALNTSGLQQFALDNCKTRLLGLPTWYEYLPTDPTTCAIQTDGLGGTAIILVIMALIDILLTLAGILAVGFIIFGGFKYITSQAEPSKLVGARQTILNAVIGLVIAIIASRVVAFIAGKLAT